MRRTRTDPGQSKAPRSASTTACSRALRWPELSKVTFDIEIQLRGPFVLFEGLLRRRFARTMRAVHAELKAYAEAGPGTRASAA